MNNKMILVSMFFFMVCSCATPNVPRGSRFSQADSSLAEASYAVSRSVVDLAEMAQAAHPERHPAAAPNPSSYGMGGLTSIDWSGPVEPLIQQIAQATQYRMRVLGRSPAIPVLVTVYSKNIMLGDALRDIGYQCGRRASVVIFPGSRVIELRYAKS